MFVFLQLMFGFYFLTLRFSIRKGERMYEVAHDQLDNGAGDLVEAIDCTQFLLEPSKTMETAFLF